MPILRIISFLANYFLRSVGKRTQRCFTLRLSAFRFICREILIYLGKIFIESKLQMYFLIRYIIFGQSFRIIFHSTSTLNMWIFSQIFRTHRALEDKIFISILTLILLIIISIIVCLEHQKKIIILLGERIRRKY